MPDAQERGKRGPFLVRVMGRRQRRLYATGELAADGDGAGDGAKLAPKAQQLS
jgi:hypothetical protein